MRAAIARAADGPASTLVLDGSALRGWGREATAAAIDPVRRRAMAARADLGAKTMVVLPPQEGEVPLLFFQGLSDGSIDMAIEVCVNSASCALTVARHCWGMTPDGPIVARMGRQAFGFIEVGA